MTKQITTYTANVTGISASNVISSASEITARQNTSTAINNTGEVVTENRELLEAIHTTDHIINVTSTSFSGGTNELSILADAIVWWDESVYRADKTADAALTGWPAKTITGLTTSNTFYIWATFVSGTKDYEATNITAALPSNLTEKALIGIATVSGAGAVTFAINWQGPTQTRENYFRDAQYFQNNVSLLGGVTNQIRTVTANYTALTTDSIILCNATSGNITITLYTSVGNSGRKLTIIKTDSSTNTVTIDGNSTETINGALTMALAVQNDRLTLICDGTNLRIESGLNTSRIRLTGGNGHGSTNTRIRRLLTTVESVGSACTYADSAVNGASITINENGLYAIGFADSASSTNIGHIGISKNSNQLTTVIDAITNSHRLVEVNVSNGTPSLNYVTTEAVWTGRLITGDIIRPHTNGATSTNADSHVYWFTEKIGV
jgi:hypothetical protein